MWISKRIAGRPGPEARLAVGEVTGGAGADVAAQGESEYRGLRLVSPWGIAFLPPAGARAVMVTAGTGESVCAGTLVPDMGIEPGELMLFSAGGARICLKNTGEVVINGQSFAPQGGA
jgi:hypothetical protein